MRRNSGFAFHCHHDVLVEWVTDYSERVKYIKESKPADERELRLKLFKLIPLRYIPDQIGELWKQIGELRKQVGELSKQIGELWKQIGELWKQITSDLERLHKELCPNCTWNGETIFSSK